MSREIKFRAWDENKIDPSSDWHNLAEFIDYHQSRDSYSTLMQYTGLKDKNGVEIYEGDLLRNAKHHDQIIEVFWKGIEIKEDNWICFGGWSFRKAKPSDDMTFATYQHAVEVIGNIYENPELVA